VKQPTLGDLTEIVGSYVDLSSVKVTEQSAFGDDIPIDSQEMLRVLSRVQAIYRIKLDARGVLGIATMGDLLALVRRYVGSL
jgi:acyl carrier protein